jgi:hypothetical protein
MDFCKLRLSNFLYKNQVVEIILLIYDKIILTNRLVLDLTLHVLKQKS